jgi:hypothetical protein
MTSDDTRNVISSPASASGPTHSETLDGQIALPFGQGAVHASHSVQAGSGKALTIRAISGPHGTGSSASVSLTSSLASRLQAVMASRGSTLFRLTWKDRATPSGRRIPALRASARRTSDNACTSWPTPNVPNGGRALSEEQTMTQKTADGRKVQVGLENAVHLAAWPTPNAGPQNDTDTTWEARRGVLRVKHGNGNGFGMTLGMAASLATWPTPTREDSESTGPREATDTRANDSHALTSAARLATWATPTSRDHRDGASEGTAPTNCLLGRQVWLAGWATPTGLTKAQNGNSQAGNSDGLRKMLEQAQPPDSGQMPNGSTAVIKRFGQLNPAHSRWLMGLPPAWCESAVTATRSVRRKPKRSSKPTEASAGDEP